MQARLVSIVIPTYNRGELLLEAIDSALGQSYKDVEVVVADDGSTDGTEERVARRYEADPRVRYFRQANQGANVARNLGLREARGEFIALLDSDDYFLPFKLELQLGCLDACPEAGMIWTDMDARLPDGSIRPAYLRTMYSNYERFPTEAIFEHSAELENVAPQLAETVGARRLYHGDIYRPMLMGNLVHTSTSLLRRERLEAVEGFDERLRRSGVDFDFHLRTCRQGPVAYADISTIHYRIELADQMTHASRQVTMAENFLATITRALEAHPERASLSPTELNQLMAEAEHFIGSAYLRDDQPARARPHLIKSYRRVRSAPTLRDLALSLLSPASLHALRRLKRQLGGMAAAVRPAPAGS